MESAEEGVQPAAVTSVKRGFVGDKDNEPSTSRLQDKTNTHPPKASEKYIVSTPKSGTELNVQEINNAEEQGISSKRCSCRCKKEEENIKVELKRHFSHTVTRCWTDVRCYRKVPYKLTIFTLKIIFVTWQLCLFARERSKIASYLDRNNVAMKHLLLKNWSQDYETMPYPPTTGVYSVYTIEEFLEHVDHVVTQIHKLPTTAVGSFFLNSDDDSNHLVICVKYFRSGVFNKTTRAISINRNTVTQCSNIGINSTSDYGLNPGIDELMRSENGVLVRLLHLTLDFSILSIHVGMKETDKAPECFNITGRVAFDNNDINGQIPVTLETAITGFECEGDNSKKGLYLFCIMLVAKDLDTIDFSFVLIFCIASLVISTRSCISSIRLIYRVKGVFEKDGKTLSRRGCWEIFRMRDVLHFISDVITIIGSAYKHTYDSGLVSTSDDLDICGILLGIGCLLIWMVSLHYWAFDKVFGLLFLVLDRSALSVMRFLICILIVYFGFALCGWAVLGPHHIKFASFSATFQCLLALMNGDEVYVTFTAVEEERHIAYVFNIVFITVFIFLFTIITLNVFIAIYNTTYEEIMDNKGRSDLMDFIDGNPQALYHLDFSECTLDNCKKCCTF